MTTLKEDLQMYLGKVTTTRARWLSFTKHLKNPDQYADHTTQIENAYNSVKIAVSLIDKENDIVKYSKNPMIKKQLEHWNLLDQGIEKVIAYHKEPTEIPKNVHKIKEDVI